MLGKVLALMSTTVATPVAAQCSGYNRPKWCRSFVTTSPSNVVVGEAEDTDDVDGKVLLPSSPGLMGSTLFFNKVNLSEADDTDVVDARKACAGLSGMLSFVCRFQYML